MNRRLFLQSAGLCGLGLSSMNAFGINALPGKSRFARNRLDELGLEYTPLAKDKVPQIIYIFLYGGPSELAGNLSNIGDIMMNSQNAYPAEFSPDAGNTIVTPNYFWRNAGGEIMEELVKSRKMSVYRTLNRVVDDSKAHGQSVTQNLLGNIDMNMPGIATNLAHIIANNNPFANDKPIEELLFPFVSFEGETAIFSLGDVDVPLAFKPISLNSNLQNPYTRRNNEKLPNGSEAEQAIEALAKSMGANTQRFPKLLESFSKRSELAEKIGTFLSPDGIEASIEAYNSRVPEGEPLIEYPDNNFGRRLKAAVSLALQNPETLFINLGSGGLGGWDDHSEAIGEYSGRMQNLMRAVKAAMRHIELASLNPDDTSYEHRSNADNIIIKIHGDFGRNVNLNNSKGWDHGNNQNLYTLGGKNIRGEAALGKIVGTTKRIGSSQQNRQFTTPTADSYQFEPFSLAASLYSYFGVTNPELLTRYTTKDGTVYNFGPIDEAVEGNTLAEWNPATE